jgi:hypothetical protein
MTKIAKGMNLGKIFNTRGKCNRATLTRDQLFARWEVILVPATYGLLLTLARSMLGGPSRVFTPLLPGFFPDTNITTP